MTKLLSYFAVFSLLHLTYIYRIVEPLGYIQLPGFLLYPILFSFVNLIFLYLSRNERLLLPIVCWLIVFVYLFFYTVFVVNLFLMNEYIDPISNLSSSVFYFVILIKYMSAFLVGFFIYDLLENERNILTVSYWVLVLITFLFVDFNTLSFDFSIYNNIEDRNSYLILSDIFAICHFLVVPSIKSKQQRILFTIISVFILYSLGSRTSLYIMLFVSFYLEFMLNGKEFRKNSLILLLILLSFFFIDFSSLLDINERMFGFLIGHSDHSASARSILLEYGMNSIRGNLIFGDFMGQVRHGGGGTFLGSYIHDYRSYLRQCGLVAFIPFLILQSWLIYISFVLQVNKIHTEQPYRNIYICLFLFLFIEMLFSRAFNYSLWMLLIGFSLIIYIRRFNE